MLDSTWSKYRKLAILEIGFVPFLLIYINYFAGLFLILAFAVFVVVQKRGIFADSTYRVYLGAMSLLALVGFGVISVVPQAASAVAVISGLLVIIAMMAMLRHLRGNREQARKP